MFLEIASFIDLLCSRMESSHHFTLTAVYLPLFSFLVTSLSWDILTSVTCHKCNRTAVECLKFLQLHICGVNICSDICILMFNCNYTAVAFLNWPCLSE